MLECSFSSAWIRRIFFFDTKMLFFWNFRHFLQTFYKFLTDFYKLCLFSKLTIERSNNIYTLNHMLLESTCFLDSKTGLVLIFGPIFADFWWDRKSLLFQKYIKFTYLSLNIGRLRILGVKIRQKNGQLHPTQEFWKYFIKK